MSEKLKLLICDDHHVFREGVRTALGFEPWIEIVGEAADGFDAIDQSLRLNPDMVLMDLNMPGLGGLDATRQIKQAQPQVKVLVISMHDEEEIMASCLAAGASGYIQKDAPFSQIIRAIDVVQKGGTYLFAGFQKKSFGRKAKDYPTKVTDGLR